MLGAGLTWREKLFCTVSYIPKATVQAAIGAVPLAAGVASGEVILAVAVLSILLTAPIGAIGIMLMGDKVLDKGEKSTYRFKELREKLGSPRVGERVKSKETGQIWKVIEEKEAWIESGASSSGQTILTPSITLRFWQDQENSSPNTGKTIECRYDQHNLTFEDHWEILYDW